MSWRRRIVWPLFCAVAAIALRAETTLLVGPQAEAFHSVQAAIDAVPAERPDRTTIDIAPGIYFGNTTLNKPHVTLRGHGPATLLTFNLGQDLTGDDGQPIGWRGCAALLVTKEGADAIIENLTLENSFGRGMQALACAIDADRVTVRNCRILGWQDTLRLESGRQWFVSCYLAGHVDFIYGAATTYFENCTIHCRAEGYIVAPATPKGQVGFVFANCRVTFPYGDLATYLGRAWRESPSATFIHCELGAGIRPEGWKEWRVPVVDVRFAEYASRGPGARVQERVPWATNFSGDAPRSFSRAAVLGDWEVAAPGP